MLILIPPENRVKRDIHFSLLKILPTRKPKSRCSKRDKVK